MTEICLLHLVRAANGLKPFQEFVEAYSRCPGGIAHEFVLLCKGFAEDELPADYRLAAGPLRYRAFFTSDRGPDLRAYGSVVRSVNFPFYSFLNSFSQPRDPDWLAKLYAWAREPSVGVAGATGSWESMYSNLFVPEPNSPHPSILDRIWRPFRVRLCKHYFRPFPNCHLRTNAFIITRELVVRLWPRLVPTKRHAYLFENGKHNLTQRIQHLGLESLVVGKDGKAYPKEEWPRSNTYRSGQQANLLVSDRQTRRFEDADLSTQRYLAKLAWGDFLP